MDKQTKMTAKNTKQQFTVITLCTLAAMIFMVVFNGVTIYHNLSDALLSVGENSLGREREQVNGYLQKSISILEISAVAVEDMIAQGRKAPNFYKLFERETNTFAEDFDENYTGIYGYILSEYIDGTGWVPPEDYVPEERAWYTGAVAAQRKIYITSPYVDAMTGKVIFSISKCLEDGKSVVSMDVTLGELQSIINGINVTGNGYSMVLQDSGLILAHTDETKVGTLFTDHPQAKELLDTIVSEQKPYIKTTLFGEKVIVFYQNIINDWYAVTVVSSEQMYQSVADIIVTHTLICILVFLLILLFVTHGNTKVMESLKHVEESRERADNMFLTVVRTLAQAIDAKDEYTKGHSWRVGTYSKEIAERLGKSEEEVQDIYHAALLHDIGKIRIPDEIIDKKGKLTDEEYNMMKIHAAAGHHILKYIKENPLIGLSAKEHHERYDGKGYPNGLSGENISEIGRIVAVADAYDAMTSNRSYRSIMSQEKVREQIVNGRGTQFDPKFADIMLQMIDEDPEYMRRQQSQVSRSILLVDDEESTLELIKAHLNGREEYSVRYASSGEIAVEMIRHEDADVILLDIQMPGMDGFATYDALKPFTNAEVVFVSDVSSRESLEKVASLGVTDYLLKPFNALALLEILHSLFQENI